MVYLLITLSRHCTTSKTRFAVRSKRLILRVSLKEDAWVRPQGGGGRTRIFEGGNIIEKGGVNFSRVLGERLPPSATAKNEKLVGRGFEAMGVSVVLHPTNPFVPTSHMNIRVFVATAPDQEPIWWFGGGFDLTPYYVFEEDCRLWHQEAKRVCDTLGPDRYQKYKEWCDHYFYLKHRNETRGVGGLFFDDLNDYDAPTCFQLSKRWVVVTDPLLVK